MKRFHRLCTTVIISLITNLFSFPGFTQDIYPKPEAENVEKTAPDTTVFYSYPKYYRNAQGVLVPVNTQLQPSANPAYDYEVIQGIWRLKVKKDGTFQAEHEGDVFTYRFNSLGVGRGSGFKPFALGEPDFSRYIVNGDAIRWSDVYRDIDLSVRYVHDILKVDVIVKNAFMADLKAEAKAGKLNRNDYLTARFDILQALITGKAKQNGQDKDLYAESLAIDQPLYFEKNGKVVHKLRPVETYLLDSKGDPIYNPEKPIRSAQVWNLKPNAPGVAEMSALIADLADLPEGDVAIDPGLVFSYANTSTKDTRLSYQFPTTNYGSNSTLLMVVGGGADSDRISLGFDMDDDDDPSALPANALIRISKPPALPGDSQSLTIPEGLRESLRPKTHWWK